jgi:hypothetical protein
MGAANRPGFHPQISKFDIGIFNDLINDSKKRPLKDYELRWLHALALENDKLGHDGPLIAVGLIALANNLYIN